MEKNRSMTKELKRGKDKAMTAIASWIVALLVIVVRRLNHGQQKLSIAQKKKILLAGTAIASMYLLYLLLTALSAPMPKRVPVIAPDSIQNPIDRLHKRRLLKSAEGSMGEIRTRENYY